MTMHTDSDEERRSRRRALIRTCHPDRGGDQAEFIWMLQRLNDEALSSTAYPEMRFARRRRWWQKWEMFRPSRRRAPRPKRVI